MWWVLIFLGVMCQVVFGVLWQKFSSDLMLCWDIILLLVNDSDMMGVCMVEKVWWMVLLFVRVYCGCRYQCCYCLIILCGRLLIMFRWCLGKQLSSGVSRGVMRYQNNQILLCNCGLFFFQQLLLLVMLKILLICLCFLMKGRIWLFRLWLIQYRGLFLFLVSVVVSMVLQL